MAVQFFLISVIPKIQNPSIDLYCNMNLLINLISYLEKGECFKDVKAMEKRMRSRDVLKVRTLWRVDIGGNFYGLGEVKVSMRDVAPRYEKGGREAPKTKSASSVMLSMAFPSCQGVSAVVTAKQS